VEFVAGPPTKWSLTLRDSRDVVEVWADSVSEQDGCFVFSTLVDATPDEQALLDITGRTPSNPARVIATVARFPVAAVDDWRSA